MGVPQVASGDRADPGGGRVRPGATRQGSGHSRHSRRHDRSGEDPQGGRQRVRAR